MSVVTLTFVVAAWVVLSVPLALGVAWLTHASREQRASTVPVPSGASSSDALGGIAAALTLPPTHVTQ